MAYSIEKKSYVEQLVVQNGINVFQKMQIEGKDMDTQEIAQSLYTIKNQITALANNDPNQIQEYIEALQDIATTYHIDRNLIHNIFHNEISDYRNTIVDNTNKPQDANSLVKALNTYHTKQQQEQQESIDESQKEVIQLKNNIHQQEQYKQTLQSYLSELQLIHNDLTIIGGEGSNRKQKRKVGSEIITMKNQYLQDLKVFEQHLRTVQGIDSSKLYKEHVDDLLMKTSVFITNMRSFYSQVQTGDQPIAKNFITPNLANDYGYYLVNPAAPNMKHNKENLQNKNFKPGSPEYENHIACQNRRVVLGNGPIGERFEQNGLLGALDHSAERLGADEQTRGRVYRATNTIRSVAKVGFTVFSAVKFVKSTWNWLWGKQKAGKDGKTSSYFGDVAFYGGLLTAGFVRGPNIDSLVKGGSTSKRLREKMLPTVQNNDNNNVSNHNISKEDQKDLELALQTDFSKKILGDIPLEDWTQFLNSNDEIDYGKVVEYVRNTKGVNSKEYKTLIEQEKSWPSIQRYLSGIGLTATAIRIGATNDSYKNDTFMNFVDNVKKEGDEIIEDYKIGTDAAKIRPTLEAIESQMRENNDSQLDYFIGHKNNIERQVNILYRKYPGGQPFNVIYDPTTKTIALESYEQKTIISMDEQNPGILPPYTIKMRKTKNIDESRRIAHLINFITDPRTNLIDRTDVEITDKQPFHISTMGDLEYLKMTRQQAILQMNKGNGLKDISILQDSYFKGPRVGELFPSYVENKKGFASWLNNFQKSNGTSLWKK